MSRTLPFTDAEQWHWRWVYLPRGIRIHRVMSAELNERDWRLDQVTTVCGRWAPRVRMPGVLSRMGAQRCRECCKRLGIQQGNGAPYNAHIEEPVELES